MDTNIYETHISKLIPDDRNANRGTERGDKLLTQSLQKGAGRSILLDRNGRIIAGNKTTAKFEELGMEDVIVVPTDGKKLVAVQRTDIDLDSPEGRELAIADNRTGQVNLEWDAATLVDLHEEIDLSDWFTPDEIAEWDAPAIGGEPENDEENTDALIDAAESGAIESRVKPGEIWQLGRHFIACGDSTDEANVRKLLGDEKIQLIWTDPPYGVNVAGGSKDPRAKTYRSGKTIENDQIEGDELRKFLVKTWKAADPHVAPGCCYYVAHPDIFAYEFIGSIRDVGWRQARPAVVLWIKDSLVFGQGDYHSRSEPILYGWKPGAAHKPVSDRTQDNVWEIERPKNVKEIHPSVKPRELVERAIINSSEEKWIVYDPFLGSGTTLLAGQERDRTVYGFELSPEYCEVICQRFENFTGQVAKLAGHL